MRAWGYWSSTPGNKVSVQLPPSINRERGKRGKDEREIGCSLSTYKVELRSTLSLNKTNFDIRRTDVVHITTAHCNSTNKNQTSSKGTTYEQKTSIMSNPNIMGKPNIVGKTRSIPETIVGNVERVIYLPECKKVQVVFDKTFPGVTLDGKGNYGETDINYVTLNKSRFTAMLCEVNEDIAFARACIGPFEQRHFGGILFKSRMVIERLFIPAGEVIEECNYVSDHDHYETFITKLTLSKKSRAFLDKLNGFA